MSAARAVLLGVLEHELSEPNLMHSSSHSKRRHVVIWTLVMFVCALVAAACGPDSEPPRLSLTSPAPASAHNGAAWAAGCSEPGVCGEASDGSGVASVRIAIRQITTGRYWNGRRFAPGSPRKLTPIGTVQWTVPLPLPSDGRYEVYGEAADTKGNASSLQLLGEFTVDTVTPLAPMITAMPGDGTMDQSAEFTFVAAEFAATFRCSIDGASPEACSAPKQYDYLEPGDHAFSVVAVDPAGNVSDATAYTWEVVPGTTFSITGSVDGNFTPGASLPLELSFTNPHRFPIEVDAVAITVHNATTIGGAPNPGCIGAENLVVTEPFTGSVVVEANATQSLSDLGVAASRWPRLHMPNLPVNQDACKGASFTLTYTGTAVQP